MIRFKLQKMLVKWQKWYFVTKFVLTLSEKIICGFSASNFLKFFAINNIYNSLVSKQSEKTAQGRRFSKKKLNAQGEMKSK